MANDNNLKEFDKQVEALLGTFKIIIIKNMKYFVLHVTDLIFDNNIYISDKVVQKESNADEELQLTGGYINTIDPISKKRIVDPVKNTICGHTYDKESITQLLKLNKKTR